MSLNGKKILIGVTGSIAAYKTCELVNSLISQGAEVRVVMTDGAQKFISPLTFQALTNSPVYCDLWNQTDDSSVEHIRVSHWPDCIVISPATANTIGKMAMGLADNLLTVIVLASLPSIKILVVPAMNSNMWGNVLVQNNVKNLEATKKFIFADPRSGVLACRDQGKGKIADTEEIIKLITQIVL